MKLVVLTGGIASGKTAVCATLAELGVPVVDADRIAREVVEPGREAHREVVEAFGPSILLPDGRIDREKLGKIVFADPDRRARLERITHPRIGARMAELVMEHAAKGAPLIVLDIPLYFEGRKSGRGAPLPPHAVVVVRVDPETQLRRLVERDGLPEADALARVRAQLPLDEKARMADHVIDNSGTPEETARQVRALWRRLREEDEGGGAGGGPGEDR